MSEQQFIKELIEVGKDDKPIVGGKGANLGEMISNLTKVGVRVPNGFVVTTDGWRRFVEENALSDKIRDLLQKIDFNNSKSLQTLSSEVGQVVEQAIMPADLVEGISYAYSKLEEEIGVKDIDVAVRSSGIAEDLEGASFAGQYETFLNIRGKADVVSAVRNCFASLFTEHAIFYRHEKGFPLVPEGIAVVIQKMVRSDKASSGVMFTVETNSGFNDLIGIEAGWGLGEPIVQGWVTPDEYGVSKELVRAGYPSVIGKTLGAKEKYMEYSHGTPEKTVVYETAEDKRDTFVLTDEEVLELSRMALLIEEHYGYPVDVEWAKDGDPSIDPRMSGLLFIVQARPVTGLPDTYVRESARLVEQGDSILDGLSAGPGLGQGEVQVIRDTHHKEQFVEGNVLVTTMTDPEWVSIMRKASAIVTDHGGQKCHAAIVARELGIPCVVGTSNATTVLQENMQVTVDCNSGGGKGTIYKGLLKTEEVFEDLRPSIELKKTVDHPKIMMILGDPWVGWRESFRPHDGIGLARLEFIIANSIGVHPNVALSKNPEKEVGKEAYAKIKEKAKGYASLKEFFVERLAQGIAQLACAAWPNPTIVRLSDFKSNEYRELLGGDRFEPHEENPMIGWRGASRYHHPDYKQAFFLECEAIKKARETLGFSNIKVMIPFCRTPEEGIEVLKVMREAGFAQGRKGLEVGMMCEIPSNVILAEEFGEIFDFFSIGSNDLTQLVFGLDRDSETIASVVDERHRGLMKFLEELFARTRRVGVPVGICGQGPSLYPELTEFLIEQGIDSISVMPDAIPRTIELVAQFQEKSTGNQEQ